MKINFSKTFLFTAVIVLANNTLSNAQSTVAGNAYLGGRFLGWGTTSGNLEFRVNNATHMMMQNTTGNIGVGIGTAAPLQRLHVGGNVIINGPTSMLLFGESLTTPANGEWGIEYEGGGLNFRKPTGSNAPGTNFLFMKDNGNIGINTNNPTARFTVNGNVLIGDASVNLPVGYKLYVQTGLLAERVKIAVVNTSDWADYVFHENYKLRSINDLEAFVKANKHLPNVPSAHEVVKEGIDLAKMDATLLEKIEELSLYIIELEKENRELAKRMNKIENK